jgi:hypothetical protein
MYVDGKMIPTDTVSEKERGRIKNNNRGGEFKSNTFDIL